MVLWDRKQAEPAPREPSGTRIPTVSFDANKVTTSVKADIAANVKAVPEIGEAYFTEMFDAAVLSVSLGRDLHLFAKALSDVIGIGPRRAGDIAIAINNKATSLIQAEEQKRLGIKYAVWRYSGAICGTPVQDAAHKAANGTVYPVEKGLLVDGRWTRPGGEDGCRCVSRSKIPGFE